MKNKKLWLAAAAAFAAASISLGAMASAAPITLKDQGSFAAGGSVVTHEGTFSEKNFLSPNGQSAYGDHAYVFYQIPEKAHAYPIVFQHGGAQTKRTWESTPDGRDGFQNIFLKKGFSVYLVDQPRSGEANLSTVAPDPNDTWGSNPMYGDKTLFILSRVGTFPDGKTPKLHDHSQFPEGAENFNQFERSWNIESAALDNDVNADALAAVFQKTGPAILMTHSMGGTIGWRLPFRTDNVKAIIAMEPGGTPFLFPENEMPKEEKAVFAPLSATAQGVSEENFNKLAKVPMLLIYGDYIASQPTDAVGSDKWRTEFDMAKQFVATVNRHGGDATLIHLPDLGIYGNSHFLMQEKNNKQIADIIENWIKEKGLEK
jgi:pimeloyl-ACP methyl ester carboxylesterase